MLAYDYRDSPLRSSLIRSCVAYFSLSSRPVSPHVAHFRAGQNAIKRYKTQTSVTRAPKLELPPLGHQLSSGQGKNYLCETRLELLFF